MIRRKKKNTYTEELVSLYVDNLVIFREISEVGWTSKVRHIDKLPIVTVSS